MRLSISVTSPRSNAANPARTSSTFSWLRGLGLARRTTGSALPSRHGGSRRSRAGSGAGPGALRVSGDDAGAGVQPRARASDARPARSRLQGSHRVLEDRRRDDAAAEGPANVDAGVWDDRAARRGDRGPALADERGPGVRRAARRARRLARAA